MNAKVSEENKTILKSCLRAYLANPRDLIAIQKLKYALLYFGEAVASGLPHSEQMIVNRVSFDKAVNLAVAEIGLTFVDEDVLLLKYFSDLVYKDLIVTDEKTGGPKNKNTIINQVATELLHVSARLPILPKMESKKSQWKEQLAILSKDLTNSDYKIKDSLSVIDGSIDTFFNRREYLDSVQFASFLQRKLNLLQDIEDQLEEAEKSKIAACKKLFQSEYNALKMQNDPAIQLINKIYAFRRYGKGLADDHPDKNRIKSAVFDMKEAVDAFVSMPKTCRNEFDKKKRLLDNIARTCKVFGVDASQLCDEKIMKDNRNLHEKCIDFLIAIVTAAKQLVRFGSALSKMGVFGLATCAVSNAHGLRNQYQKHSRSC